MRRATLSGAILVALALAAVHWLGLLVGGIVVGVAARSWPRALVGGIAFGVVAWLLFAALLTDAGRFVAYLDSGQLLYVSVAIPVMLGLVGSLAYGLISRERTA